MSDAALLASQTASLAALLRGASRALIFTGAGISVDSGLPTFRGPDGVWQTRKPVEYQDFLASETSRREYWQWKLDSWDLYRDAEPNAIHRAVHRLDEAGRLEAVVTQNVDGLHLKSGHRRQKVLELHGSNLAVQCQTCRRRDRPDDYFEEFRQTGQAPVCDSCGGFWKPATISFGQDLDGETLQAAIRAAQACDLVVAIGSTLQVTPACSVPVVAAQRGVPYVILNLGETAHDYLPMLSLRINAPAGDIFPAAVNLALEI